MGGKVCSRGLLMLGAPSGMLGTVLVSPQPQGVW